jgi:hypothetical protein
MQKLNINRSIVEVTKNEGNEVQRLKDIIEHNREQAERAADIWMRSAPDDKAAARRKAVCRALGLPDTVRFL